MNLFLWFAIWYHSYSQKLFQIKAFIFPKKFAKHLCFPLFAEIKFSRFNLTWRTAAKEVNLQHALQQDKLFIAGRQSSEKCEARFSSSGCYLRNPPHPTNLLSEVIVWKFRPAHTVYISVWHCQHFLRSSPLIDSFHCSTKQRWTGADTWWQRHTRCQG